MIAAADGPEVHRQWVGRLVELGEAAGLSAERFGFPSWAREPPAQPAAPPGLPLTAVAKPSYRQGLSIVHSHTHPMGTSRHRGILMSLYFFKLVS